MALSLRSGRARHRLVLLLLTAITFLTLDFRDFGPLDGAQSAVRDLLEPVVSLTSTVLSPVSDGWNGLFGYDELEAENERLREELDALRGEQIAAQADREAFEALLEAVDLDYATDLERVVAEVTRRGVGNFDDDVITIDRGTRDGLEVDMAVVTNAGLVGRIAQVDATTSIVQLLSDPELVVGVRLVGIDEVGLARARAGTAGAIFVDQGIDWPEDGDLSALPPPGTAVVTDALSKYPIGIPVGLVAEVDTDDDLTMIVEVTLTNKLDDLSYVAVLLESPPDEIVVPPTTLPVDLEPDLTQGEEGDGE